VKHFFNTVTNAHPVQSHASSLDTQLSQNGHIQEAENGKALVQILPLLNQQNLTSVVGMNSLPVSSSARNCSLAQYTGEQPLNFGVPLRWRQL
jgi:hypothetical protein